MTVRQALLAAVAAVGLGAASVAVATSAVPPPSQGTLQQYNVSSTYVSGLSSGGYLANQLHVAYSSVFRGAGIFSAGAYDCAQDNLSTALNACMNTTSPRRTPAQLEQETRDRASAGAVDPVANLAGSPVWLFHGTSDSTIAQPVMDDLATYYRDLGATVAYDSGTASGHAWVSPLGKNPCSATTSPYVNNCGGDPVGDMLAHLFGSVHPPSSAALTGKLVQFDQNAYAPGGSAAAISMGGDGFAYVPKTCQDGASCRLMVTLHGCYQYFGLVGNALMDQAYLNEYADTNAMIVLYPQATTMSGNPRGCWDWWGYQSAQYAQRSGPQLQAIVRMVAALRGGSTPPPTTTPPPQCVTASNYDHTVALRAYALWGLTYAAGSNQPLGLWNIATFSSLRQTSPGYWVTC
ncbi:poly(3-hydroxybutyrate) depolymerase [Solihabitans fulvus]|uniref:Poly(3-hydroxybutyrate) depolymerase n=1 Tax=Solihabitans fulvus TaxID=1892852 RepID=A0A5B2XFK3_9PSEU|nr:PHB depolymerase family esterase [Solihabitans fulvus]KAA2261582.1 poly(3-hydroxybutyrate) depolymerase [Solihabitans fulvus]